MAASLKILIAPLDWGLGHTTRCIPLVRYLLQEGHQVTVAAEGASARLLQENFPGLALLPLEGYRIRYSNHKTLFTIRILLQVPKILSAIRSEKKWLEQMQQIHHFDWVISDNRYGLYHSGIPCCILTHQLQIKSGQGRWADRLLRRLHYKMLNRFNACWIVDEAANGGLSGDLAHPSVTPPRAAYMGILSQFSDFIFDPKQVVTNRVLVLLSGPEPMRTQLEQLVLEQAAGLTQYEFIIVAGNPLGAVPAVLPEQVTYYTHLASKELAPLLASAALVVSRSGYSTIMDLTVLGKRALLIPTPGQTEQEYLALYLQKKKYYSSTLQNELHLAVDIPKALTAALLPLKPSDYPNRIKEVTAPFVTPTVPQPLQP